SGTTWSSVTGDLLGRMPPTMIAPMTSTALSLPFIVLTNSASPIVPPAPPLLVTWAPALWRPSLSSAARTALPVESQPPPGLAGTIILMGSAARARNGARTARARSVSVAFLIRCPSVGVDRIVSGSPAEPSGFFPGSFYPSRRIVTRGGRSYGPIRLEDPAPGRTIRQARAGRGGRFEPPHLLGRELTEPRRETEELLAGVL